MTALGDLIEIDDRTVLVLGQELDVEHGQPDVANAFVHRVADTLVLVDTGVTAAFRVALRAAADRVGPRSRALVLTTHGHLDHVGNNDLADELGVPVEHYVPALDLDQMRDPTTYWVRSFDRIAGSAPLPAPPAAVAHSVVSFFQPTRPFGATTRTYEELPLERIRIGPLRLAHLRRAPGRGSGVLPGRPAGPGHCPAGGGAQSDRGERQVRPSAFTTRYAEAIAELGVGGANPNAMFTAMMTVNQLRELGLRPESDAADAPWSRPTLPRPAPILPRLGGSGNQRGA
ncbi:MBL fold metallo-hydrolase [Streptomyces xanthophaeus]|uniref:MBL fold metallo-hydrolase n=1 Tax=Streptomyces xanthophaeus TaxID=67385 RepID=UPI003433158A